MKRVALWGPSASGKTVLLAFLFLRFPNTKGRWSIRSNRKTQDFINRHRKLLIDEGEFPLGTSVTGEEIQYDIEDTTTGQLYSLFTEDKAGSLSENMREEDVKRFTESHGLVVMIDPTRQQYETEVKEAVETFSHEVRETGMKKDPRPVAFCLAKADRYIDTPENWRLAHEQPEQFVKQLLHKPELQEDQQQFTDYLEGYCETCRFFPVSSAGVRLAHGSLRPGVYYDEKLTLRLARGAQPIHLFTPFQWIFEELK